ncbi:hypothetical protein FRC09_004118 [Ceratobasidium sp. 395]|nr:hypothetical protein FRC09_004118 [Ceratobasidium sp. 395]
MAQTTGYSRVIYTNAPSRVLAIPELLWRICEFLDKNSCVAWLCTSRRLFESIVPFVWKDVDLVAVVLLIPGVTVAADGEWPGQLDVDDFPKPTDLEQFKVYSPFVRTARTTSPYAIQFPETWFGANATQELPQPLLSNLRTLIINAYGRVDGLYLDWIPRLLTPDLKELKMYICSAFSEPLEADHLNSDGHAWVDRGPYEQLIDAVHRICPGIEALDILPIEDGSYWSDRCATVCKVASLRNLRSLSFGGSGASQPFFQAFEQLPRLESLTFVTIVLHPYVYLVQ